MKNILGLVTREQIIKNPKPYFDFDQDYQYFVCHYKRTELNPDVILLDYEQSINQNRYIKNEYPDFAKELWLFANSGCGDMWFLHKISKQVLFYDHDQGEFSSFDDFTIMSVEFKEFVNLILILEQFQQKLDNDLIDDSEQYFLDHVYHINPNFFTIYPYQIY